ncbi:hypothetical protein [Nocardia brasiliensis]|uniref:hypothetical protein n=1 Tax=Nocardia brasiliensis TaxID=37326 RepID=UPI003D91DAD2
MPYVEGVLATSILDTLGGLTTEDVAVLPAAPSADLRYDRVVDAHDIEGSSTRGVASGVHSYRDSALMTVEVTPGSRRAPRNPAHPLKLSTPANSSTH